MKIRPFKPEFFATMGKTFRKKIEVVYEPARPGEIQRSSPDISKARKLLGYEPEVSLDEGLEETWKWFLAHSEKKGHAR